MKQHLANTIFSKAGLLPPLQQDVQSFTKDNPEKACKYRTVSGYCNRSNRQCPAALFTFNLNN
jgi:hypothetical protein